MYVFNRQDFDHIGVTVEAKPESAVFVPATRVWVTSPRAHSANVEFLYYEPDSPITGPVKDLPHVAYRTLDLDAAIAEFTDVLIEPFEAGGGFVRAAFVLHDGMPIELMQYANPDESGWFE